MRVGGDCWLAPFRRVKAVRSRRWLARGERARAGRARAGTATACSGRPLALIHPAPPSPSMPPPLRNNTAGVYGGLFLATRPPKLSALTDLPRLAACSQQYSLVRCTCRREPSLVCCPDPSHFSFSPATCRRSSSRTSWPGSALLRARRESSSFSRRVSPSLIAAPHHLLPSCSLTEHKDTGRKKGFGFVDYCLWPPFLCALPALVCSTDGQFRPVSCPALLSTTCLGDTLPRR